MVPFISAAIAETANKLNTTKATINGLFIGPPLE
jgi:hypothetical protein